MCWVFCLPKEVIDLIYEYDSTFREKYSKVVAEFNYITADDFIIKHRISQYEKYVPGYASISINGRVQQSEYYNLPALIKRLSQTQCNTFTRMELYCMKYDYMIREVKQELLRPFKRYKNKCTYKFCEKPVSPSRYKIRQPSISHLFCSYDCHNQFYNRVDQTIRPRDAFLRPVFKDNGFISTNELCYPPNYWKLNPSNELWEIVWVKETEKHNRYNRIYTM
jgi:hypothetical protein